MAFMGGSGRNDLAFRFAGEVATVAVDPIAVVAFFAAVDGCVAAAGSESARVAATPIGIVVDSVVALFAERRVNDRVTAKRRLRTSGPASVGAGRVTIDVQAIVACLEAFGLHDTIAAPGAGGTVGAAETITVSVALAVVT